MNKFNLFESQDATESDNSEMRFELRLKAMALHRILRFNGYTIHDLVNDGMVKNAVLAYYRLDKQIGEYCAKTGSSQPNRGRVSL